MTVMTAVPAEANLSDLLNKPKATLARLADNRRLVLHRRDAEDLVLTTAERAAADTAVVRDTTRRSRRSSRRGGTRRRSTPIQNCLPTRCVSMTTSTTDPSCPL